MTELERLVRLVAKLRSPGGCPWDRKQTHESLIRYLREEAREVEQALRKGDWHDIEDELGDLLLQVLLHARIKEEEGRFDIEDVARSQHLKLRRRHPHVFGGPKYKTAEAVLADWDAIKASERKLRAGDVERRVAGRPKRPSPR
ncbi:MAG: hypothetical protein HY554_04555 [Elusimicrobia bacterium]|nr:hypothetical protein [Elusimicrobiota bacterium]